MIQGNSNRHIYLEMVPWMVILIFIYLTGLVMDFMHGTKIHFLWYQSLNVSIIFLCEKFGYLQTYILRYDKYCDVRVGAVGNCSPVIPTDVMMTKSVYPGAAWGSSQINCENE